MKTIRTIGYLGVASFALAALTPTAAVAEDQSATNPGSVVQRVSHALATTEQYTAGSTNSGYKWGKQAKPVSTDASWAGSLDSSDGGYKWGVTSASVAPTVGIAEKTGSRWGRRDFSEQAGSRWGRRDFSEQAGSRWGRRDFSEQAGSRWGRRDFSEQAGSRWGRRDFSEQAGSRWGRR